MKSKGQVDFDQLIGQPEVGTGNDQERRSVQNKIRKEIRKCTNRQLYMFINCPKQYLSGDFSGVLAADTAD